MVFARQGKNRRVGHICPTSPGRIGLRWLRIYSINTFCEGLGKKVSNWPNGFFTTILSNWFKQFQKIRQIEQYAAAKQVKMNTI